jgi:hypothetical protein
MKTGKELRDMAMAQVEIGSRKSQKLAAIRAIKACVQKFHPSVEWTTDDVHGELAKAEVTLQNARLLGPLMKNAQGAEMIEPVICLLCKRQETRPSARPERHAGPQYLWRSTNEGFYSRKYNEPRKHTYDNAFWDNVDRQIDEMKEDRHLSYSPELELGGEG